MAKITYKNPKEANKKVKKIKDTLSGIISEMTKNASSFVVHPDKDFTRNRIFTFEKMLQIILSMGGQSLGKELSDYFGETKDYATKSAFVQQRDKIRPNAFKYMLHEFNRLSSDDKTYMGYRLFACDGTSVNISRNPNNKETYVNTNKKSDGFNQYHVNTLYDLLNKTYVDAIVQGICVVNEPKAVIEMINSLPLDGKTILIGDRGYAALNLIEHCRRKEGLDFLIRTKESWITEVKALPMEECDVDINLELRTTNTKADKEAYKNGTAKHICGKSKFGKYIASQAWDFESPHKMAFRVVRFKISEDKYETIATSLDRFAFPVEKIKELYNLRWGIETSYRDLKYSIGMVYFHARKDDSIMQEVFASLVMYNFCERITACAVIVYENPRVHAYQVNFTISVHICQRYFTKHDKAPPAILEEIIQHIEPVRPGRSGSMCWIYPKTVINFIYRVA